MNHHEDVRSRSAARGGRFARALAIAFSMILVSGGIAWAASGGLLNAEPGSDLRSAVYEPPGSISGTVTSNGSAPLADICVKAYDSDNRYSGYDETGADGRYLLSGLPADQYRLKFYDCADNGVARQFYDNKQDLDSADPVSVESNSITTNVNLVMPILGSISGTVSNGSADPLADICARAFDAGGNYFGFDRTDSDGYYKIGALVTGSYKVRFADCGDNNVLTEYYDDKSDLESATPVAVTTGVETSAINAQLATGGSITGTVKNSGDEGLVDICVRAFDDSGASSGRAVTRTDGSYRLGGLTTGSYRVRFTDCGDNNVFTEFYDDKPDLESATPVAVTTGIETSAINAQLATGGSITGTVTNNLNQPLENICVDASSTSGNQWGSARTNADGSYSITRLSSGTYRVEFRDCGGNRVLREYYENKKTYNSATLISVATGVETPNIDAQLTIAGSISGTVLSNTSAPLKGICVRAYDSNGHYVDFTRTDVDGQYLLSWMDTGEYRVQFEACGSNNVIGEYFHNKPNLDTATRISVTAGVNTPEIDARLARGGSISGVVKNSSNVPLNGICVRTFNPYGQRTGDAKTDAEGKYSVVGLDEDDHRVRFSDCGNNNVLLEFYDNKPTVASATPVPVGIGEDTPGIDAELATAGSITGNVTDGADAPLSDICVNAYRPNGSNARSGYTDSSGEYVLGNLSAGDYKVRFRDCGNNDVLEEYFNDKPSLSAANLVTVQTGAPTNGIDATLAKAGSISGKVTNVADQPLRRICVRAFNSNGKVSGNAGTATDGTYRVRRLGSGNYRVRFYDCGNNNVLEEFYENKSTLALADPIPVAGGSDTPGIDAQLASAGSISGRVTDSSGAPLGDICVAVFDTNGFFEGETYTGSSGHYTFGGLPTGDYRVRFRDCGNNNFIREFYDDQPDLASATPIGVTTGLATTGVDAQLASGGRISGNVKSSMGFPLGDICVEAYDADGDYMRSVYTDSNGDYSLGGLATGEYRIGFYDCGGNGVSSEYYDDEQDFESATPVAVAIGSETSGVDAELSVMGSVTGTITSSLNRPLANICVFARVEIWDGYWGIVASAFSDVNGNYAIRGLNTDSYVIQFVDCGNNYVDGEYYDNVPSQDLATPVTVSTGSVTSGINAQLAEQRGAISGKVTGSGGVGLEDICVRTFDSSGTRSGDGRTNASGDYLVSGLSNGNHRVRFTDCGDNGAVSEFFDDKTNLASATPVAVTSGTVAANINAELVTVDTIPPDTVIGSGPSGTITVNQATFAFAGNPVSDTAKVQCRIDSEPFVDCSSPKTFSGLADGVHTAAFRAEDAAGNQDPTPATRTFTVDTTAPDTVIGSGPSGTITVNQATFAFAGNPVSDTAK
ncbi:MAG TPA: carboxypeptidase regulatory-like domain-containing protein, partial [Solirubrobacterales bacterium]|nr:carboxypeptidase regulatory-like domain-containing protein [Solirubrobacterales bacterium]